MYNSKQQMSSDDVRCAYSYICTTMYGVMWYGEAGKSLVSCQAVSKGTQKYKYKIMAPTVNLVCGGFITQSFQLNCCGSLSNFSLAVDHAGAKLPSRIVLQDDQLSSLISPLSSRIQYKNGPVRRLPKCRSLCSFNVMLTPPTRTKSPSIHCT